MSEQDPEEGIGCSMHYRPKEGCPICDVVKVAYAPKPKTDPVMIPVTPRFDPEGRPTCDGCPMSPQGFAEWCVVLDDHLYGSEPPKRCPIHFEEAREGIEPL